MQFLLKLFLLNCFLNLNFALNTQDIELAIKNFEGKSGNKGYKYVILLPEGGQLETIVNQKETKPQAKIEKKQLVKQEPIKKPLVQESVVKAPIKPVKPIEPIKQVKPTKPIQKKAEKVVKRPVINNNIYITELPDYLRVDSSDNRQVLSPYKKDQQEFITPYTKEKEPKRYKTYFKQQNQSKDNKYFLHTLPEVPSLDGSDFYLLKVIPVKVMEAQGQEISKPSGPYIPPMTYFSPEPIK